MIYSLYTVNKEANGAYNKTRFRAPVNYKVQANCLIKWARELSNFVILCQS